MDELINAQQLRDLGRSWYICLTESVARVYWSGSIAALIRPRLTIYTLWGFIFPPYDVSK